MSDKLAKLCIDDVCKVVEGGSKGLLVNVKITNSSQLCEGTDNVMPNFGIPDKTWEEITTAYKEGTPVTYCIEIEKYVEEQPYLATMVANNSEHTWSDLDPETFNYRQVGDGEGNFIYKPTHFRATTADPTDQMFINIANSGVGTVSSHVGVADITFTPQNEEGIHIVVCHEGHVFDWNNMTYDGVPVGSDLPDGVLIYHFTWKPSVIS